MYTLPETNGIIVLLVISGYATIWAPTFLRYISVCWPLKRQCLQYLRHLFYNKEELSRQHSHKFHHLDVDDTLCQGTTKYHENSLNIYGVVFRVLPTLYVQAVDTWSTTSH